jgi:predicted aspartyl protease
MKFPGEVALVTTIVAIATIMLAGQGVARESAANIGDFNFEGEQVVLSLTENAMHPKVVVDLGDGEHYEFIVDTGAGVNVIDSSIAESLGLEVVGEMEIGAPGGPQIPGNIVLLPVARIGDATVTQAEFVTMDIKAFSGGTTQGVIGVRMFDEHLVAFDLGGGEVTISRGSLVSEDPGVVPYNASNGQVEIDVDVAGTPVGTHIDTGSMGGLMLPREMVDSLPLKSAPKTGSKARLVGGERDISFAELEGSIQFAGHEYENPNLAFMSPSSGHGNMGGKILDQMIMSIDQKQHLISFQRTSDSTTAIRSVAKSVSSGSAHDASTGKPRRLGVQFRGMPGGSVLTIGDVHPGSLGEQAGLLPGDVLVTLNDRPTEEYGMGDLRELFGGSEPLTFEVQRDGVAQTIEIK